MISARAVGLSDRVGIRSAGGSDFEVKKKKRKRREKSGEEGERKRGRGEE